MSNFKPKNPLFDPTKGLQSSSFDPTKGMGSSPQTYDHIKQTPGQFSPTPVVRDLPSHDQVMSRNEELRQAPVSWGRKIMNKMPGFIQDAETQIKEGLFGYEKERASGFADQYSQNRAITPIPYLGGDPVKGFIPSIGRTPEEQAKIFEKDLLKKGMNPERARDIASYKAFESKNSNLERGPDGKFRFSESNLDKMNLTKEEKNVLKWASVRAGAGQGLDALSFLPIGSIQVKKSAATQIAKSKSAGQIKSILQKEIPDLADDLADVFAKFLVNADDAASVKDGLNKLEFLYRGVKPGVSQITPTVTGAQSAVSPFVRPGATTAAPGAQTLFQGGKQALTQASEIESLQQVADQTPQSIFPGQQAPQTLPQEPVGLVPSTGTPRGDMLEMATPPPSGVKIRPIKEVDWDDLPLRDIGGIAGGKSLNMRDAAFSIDNLDVFEMAKRGDVGPVVKSFYNFKEAEGSMFEWVDQTRNALRKVISQLNTKEKTQLAQFRLKLDKKELPPKLQKINKELTNLTDEIRSFRNDWAKSSGVKEMGYLEDYLTKKSEAPLFTGRQATKPSARYTLPRTDAPIQGVQEQNLEKILSSYINGIGREVYLSGPLEQLKGVSGVLESRGVPRGAKFIDDFVKETLNPNIPSSFLEKGAQAVTGARSTAALLGNIDWSFTTQPLSLALTIGRNPQAKAIIKGFGKSFSKSNKNWLKTLPTYREKVERPMSATGLGDLDSSKLTFSQKREGFNRTVGFLSDQVEAALSNISANIAREYAQSIGLKGDALDMYSDLMIGATQSEYTKTARPEALKSIWTRLFAPFQTFAFESYRFGKTLFGAPGGGIPIKQKAQRLKQASAYITATLALDWMQSRLTGRRKTTVGSHIPIVGSVIDQSLSWGLSNVTGKDIKMGSLGSYGRTPVSIYDDLQRVQRAIDKFIKDGDKNPLRRELIKWGMGFSNIGGASTINRIFDNLDEEDSDDFDPTKGLNTAIPTSEKKGGFDPTKGLNTAIPTSKKKKGFDPTKGL